MGEWKKEVKLNRSSISGLEVLTSFFTQHSSCALERASSSTLIFLCFFDELRLKFHRTYAFNFAIDVMVAFYQTNIFHLGSNFYDRG
ncbi:hypothetical protein H206_03404 [Candidatus Electrothrix aarhusensis]|uniref:Uncharacterized protein n=1 Tax=Candidatus Electrothrix aarhusensis TaxID=1859131 RepID=A0A444IPY7_9BACT|nr:hypothetical protein H206_03404 [Candidatus Electrothrix aarhusensis]